MDMVLLEWIGYVASGIIALSMTMNSIVKFRWINLIGAFMFAFYGLLIDAYPVMVLNGFIIAVDIYYLIKIYSRSFVFDILDLNSDNNYLEKFLAYHNDDIQKYFPEFRHRTGLDLISFIVLRNTTIAGLFIARKENNNVLNVCLDYAMPEYRDYRNGKFIINHLRETFKKKGYNILIANKGIPKHNAYLKKLGFNEQPSGDYEIKL
jgi:hypothetical protein